MLILYKICQACHNDLNGMKPGNNLRLTDKNAAEYSKAACYEINDFVRCMSCSYHILVKPISLPDKNRRLRLYNVR